MAQIIGLKFRNTGKVYYFAPKDEEYKKGDGVIVETARGVEYARVSIERKEVDDSEIVQPLKPVIRRATEKDEQRNAANIAKEPEAKKIAEEKIAARGLKMKLIEAEYTFDGSKLVFYFTAPGRIDFRDLVKDLASHFHVRIELRQVGIRDETRILGGIGACGRECCCASCLPDFRKVSIKMAKYQGLSLNPQKISGLCGRLMCCLEYENDYYAEAYKKMPRIGSQVGTPEGKGMVIGLNMLKFLVKVKIDKGNGELLFKEYPLEEIKFSKKGNDDEPKLTKEEEAELKKLETD
ncbi:MAG: stage 0 sporulation family protein [Clostridia bacterium]|nr:stage 0 sporulation family protein [Clostridia bacterium]